MRIVREYPLSTRPESITLDRNRGVLYVAQPRNSSTSIFNTRQHKLLKSITMDGRPTGLAVNETTGNVYVTHGVRVEERSSVSVIGRGGIMAEPVPVPLNQYRTRVAVNKATNRVYVTNYDVGGVSVIDGVANQRMATIDVGRCLGGLAVNEATNRIYVANYGQLGMNGTLEIINGVTNEVLGAVRVGQDPKGTAVNQVTNRVYVTNARDGTVSVINGVTNGVLATVEIAPGGFANGVAVNATKNRIYVTGAVEGNGMVAVINGVTNQVENTMFVDQLAREVAVDEVNNTIYVTSDDEGDRGKVLVIAGE